MVLFWGDFIVVFLNFLSLSGFLCWCIIVSLGGLLNCELAGPSFVVGVKNLTISVSASAIEHELSCLLSEAVCYSVLYEGGVR